jgi:hypothetical protein
MLRIMSASVCLSVAALALTLNAEAAGAAPSLTSPIAATSSESGGGVIAVGYRRYYDDDYYDHVPPSYYAPRVYGYVQRYGYGPPPRPSSCGKYRYWDGEACVDARFRPPYVGPRW